jgi:adenylyl- and sulfurtransferase ThiI
MERMLLIKYGELTTKKGNRKQFIDILTKNIKNKLYQKGYKYSEIEDIMNKKNSN